MGTLVGFTITTAGLFLKAFVLCRLWDWFVYPIFGVGEIGIAYAIGLGVVASLLTQRVTLGDLAAGKDESKEMELKIANSVLLPLVALLIGWIAQMFV